VVVHGWALADDDERLDEAEMNDSLGATLSASY
jgi:hypothetical protein